MAVKLRLRREGTKKRPHYRIVVADSRSPRNGRFIEILGEYHPLDNPSRIVLDDEKALEWLRNGAQPTEAVLKILRIQGVWETFRPGDTGRERDPDRKKVSRQQREKAAEAED